MTAVAAPGATTTAAGEAGRAAVAAGMSGRTTVATTLMMGSSGTKVGQIHHLSQLRLRYLPQLRLRIHHPPQLRRWTRPWSNVMAKITFRTTVRAAQATNKQNNAALK